VQLQISAVLPSKLKYKVHQTIDAESRVILDAEVTTGGRHDNQPYLEQLRRIEDRKRGAAVAIMAIAALRRGEAEAPTTDFGYPIPP
jgi:hypothetical protein